MTIRSNVIVAIALLAAGCGGGQQTPTTGATSAPIGPGEPITTEQVQAAIETLQAQESWQFEASTITMGIQEGMQTTVIGTERTTPEQAVDATHAQPDSDTPFRYVRIGDTIWYDVGTGEFTEVQSEDAANLIEQYEPYYIAGLAESLSDQGFEFEPAGEEVVSGINTMHYALSEADKEEVTQTLDIDPAAWAGDVWIATDGGYAMKVAWGPQSIQDAQISIGFNYLVTAVNCECPIEPPA